MILFNQTRKRTIATDAQTAKTLWEKTAGLLNPKNSRFLIIHTRFGIHTFLLKNSIDVLLLNRQYRVVKLVENLSPNRLLFYWPCINTVIEMPAGTIKKFGFKQNDKIFIE